MGKYREELECVLFEVKDILTSEKYDELEEALNNLLDNIENSVNDITTDIKNYNTFDALEDLKLLEKDLF